MEEFEPLLEQLKKIEYLLLRQLRNEIMTLNDLVSLTGWSKSYIYKLTSGKHIPHYKPGGKSIYFKREEVEKFLFSENSRVSTIDEIKEESLRLFGK